MAKEKLFVSTAGVLMGDAWAMLCWIIELCKIYEVTLICGIYSLPVFEFALKHVIGANYAISDFVVRDHDVVESDYAPGKGFLAVDKATAFVRSMFNESVFSIHYMDGSYRSKKLRLKLEDQANFECNHIVVQHYTRHEWKNVGDILSKVPFERTAYEVGGIGEPSVGHLLPTRGAPFEDIILLALRAHCIVSVLSSFAALGAVFGRKQLVVSFTEDAHYIQYNPKARILINPEPRLLRRAIIEEGL